MDIGKAIKWTNDNSGFLSIILFFATILYGWLSGFFGSIIKKPKIKVRFIEKLLFFSTFDTGEKYLHNDGTEYDTHKTAFAIYMAISNVGNMTTTIEKIHLSYYKSEKSFFKKKIWLSQWHTIEPFYIPVKEDNLISINSLMRRDHQFDFSDKTSLEVGKSLLGVAYFEQLESWGNYLPLLNKDGTTTIYIKICDIYGKNYKFKTNIKHKVIEEARVFNKDFGNIDKLLNY